MSRILDLANELSQEIADSQEYRDFLKSKEEIAKQPDSFILFNDYKNLQRQIQAKQNSGQEITEEEMSQINALKEEFQKDVFILNYLSSEEKVAELIAKVNSLFEGELTDQDKLVYVNHVIKGKLLESQTLRKQAASNTKEQFANSPDLKTELLNAIMGALDAHNSMSTQALNSDTVQRGIKDVLLNNAGLYESLRDKGAG